MEAISLKESAEKLVGGIGRRKRKAEMCYLIISNK